MKGSVSAIDVKSKKRIFAICSMTFSLILVLSCFLSVKAYASSPLTVAAVGNTVPTAEWITFDEDYVGGWSKYDDHLNCYSRLSVTSRGTVTMKVSKPYDSEGEYGGMYFDLTNEDGEAVWWEKTSDIKIKSGSTFYKYSFNLDPGVYYMNMTPAFTVISGIIEFNYSFSFKADRYAITEPNGDLANACKLEAGHVYSGYFGSNIYSGHGDNNECMVFTAPSDGKYNIKIGNYDTLDATTWIGTYRITGESEKSISDYDFDKTDSNGFIYKAVNLKKGQSCFLRYHNCSEDQMFYQVAFTRVSKPSIAKAMVTLATLQYTKGGKDPQAKPIVKLGGKTLKLGTDYGVSYRHDAKSAVTTVTITGMNNYTGQKVASYTLAYSGYALLKADGNLWACSKNGKSANKKMASDSVGEVNTLFVDPSVKTVPKIEGFSKLDTVVFTVNSRGKNACKTIDIRAFENCEKLKNVKNLEKTSVCDIRDGAFENCSSLMAISLPETVKRLGRDAFCGCDSLKLVKGLEKTSIKIMHTYTFSACRSLRSIELPKSLKGIQKCAFYWCEKLKSVRNLDKTSVASIGELAFADCKSLKSISLPKTVKKIGPDAFSGCYKLESVKNFEKASVKTIGTHVFAGCKSLKTIMMPKSIKSIPASAFFGCYKLETVKNLKKTSLTSIGSSAFENCKSLASLPVPKTLKIIGRDAFKNCPKLKDVKGTVL